MPLSGYINQEDLLELETLKQELFPDYNLVKKALENKTDQQNGVEKRHHRSVFLKKDDRKIYADMKYDPLSYSGVVEPKPSFTNYGEGKFGLDTECKNVYYNAILEKKDRLNQRLQMTEIERKNQNKLTILPASGFFSTKANKNPSLFESLMMPVSERTIVDPSTMRQQLVLNQQNSTLRDPKQKHFAMHEKM